MAGFKLGKFGAGLSLIFWLSACSIPHVLITNYADPGQSLDPGERVALHFFTKEPNFDTGIALQVGQPYALNVTILSYWIDSHIEENELQQPLDERGFDNSLMSNQWLGLTRRSREHRWFELMLFQPNCRRESLRGVTDLEQDQVSGGYRFVAACDGKLFLFVNDAHGYYSNNVGYANLSLARVN